MSKFLQWIVAVAGLVLHGLSRWYSRDPVTASLALLSLLVFAYIWPLELILLICLVAVLLGPLVTKRRNNHDRRD